MPFLLLILLVVAVVGGFMYYRKYISTDRITRIREILIRAHAVKEFFQTALQVNDPNTPWMGMYAADSWRWGVVNDFLWDCDPTTAFSLSMFNSCWTSWKAGWRGMIEPAFLTAITVVSNPNNPNYVNREYARTEMMNIRKMIADE